MFVVIGNTNSNSNNFHAQNYGYKAVVNDVKLKNVCRVLEEANFQSD